MRSRFPREQRLNGDRGKVLEISVAPDSEAARGAIWQGRRALNGLDEARTMIA
jgi:hypothetical protein